MFIYLIRFFAAIIVSAVKAPPDMLVEVDRGKNYVIVYDRDTGVMYCMNKGSTRESCSLYIILTEV